MKYKKKKLIIITIIAILIMGTLNTTFAGFADYDDETAEKVTQNLLEEQKKREEEAVGKSTNNYLSDLRVEGFTLTPNFDKQTLEYYIETDVESINIIAEKEDQRANVSGAGTVKLQDGENNIRIDVEAESGTVRTYFIKVKTKQENEKNNEEETIKNEEIVETSAKVEEQKTTEQPEKKDNYIKTLVLAIVLIGIVAVIMILFKKSSKKK